MATFIKKKLSGSTDGKAVKVTGTSTGATVTVHTAVAGTTEGTFDEVWIYANNTSTTAINSLPSKSWMWREHSKI